ncbi:unnamed protein product [Withania somnifera]
MWGFIHALGYHSWQSRVKRKSLPRINEGSNRMTGIYSSKEKLVGQDPSELEMLLDDNESHFLIDTGTRKSKGSKKRSLKAKIKDLIAEEMHMEKKSKQKKLVSSDQPKFQRNCSIHHVEPTEHDLSEICSDQKHPIILVPLNVENGATVSPDKKRMNAIDEYDISTDKSALKSQLKDHAELLLEILRESETEYQNFSRGSYPVSHLSQKTNFKPIKLEDKKNEVWSLFTSLGLLDDDGGNLKLDKLPNFACRSTKGAADNKENNEELTYAEEGIIQSSTYELFENLNGEHESKSNEYSEIDGFDRSKNTVMHKRSSSLNESMDRYTELFDHSFRKEVNLNPSKSLKLTDEYEIPASSVPFRRIRSLSYFDSSSLLPNGVADDPQFSEWLIKTVEERNSHMRDETENKETSIYATEETGCKIEKEEGSQDIKTVGTITSLKPKTVEADNGEVKYLSEIIKEVKKFKGNSCEEQGTKCKESILSDVVPNSEICFGEDISNSSEFQISKEVLNPSIVRELESLWHEEQECGLGDFDFCCHHELLFDLVNEVVVQMYDRSFTYYPKALSYSCRIRPLLENRMIEEVSNNVGKLLILKPEQESIDAIVDQDLRSDDGWMNLQIESECSGLELEDMIFNDLLEELRCF